MDIVNAEDCAIAATYAIDRIESFMIVVFVIQFV